jgi:putative ABC transport system permease protein
MSLLDGLRHRLHVLLRGERYARDIERELRFHTELDALARSSEGLDRVDAELGARRTLGNATYYREEVRRMTLQTWLDRIRQNTIYGARGLKRSPGFTIAVVLTLGLGIGVNGAMFSLLNRIFLQPPARVVQPRDVRRLYLDLRDGFSGARFASSAIAYPQLRALRAAIDSSVTIGAYIGPESTMVRDGTTRIPARRSLVTNDYFSVLGVRPAAGRVFGREEADVAVPAPVIVISDAFWHRAFNADRSVLGHHVKIEARDYAIVGITPPGFTGVDINAVDVWVPVSNYEGGGGRGGEPWYSTFGAQLHVLLRVSSAAQEERLADQAANAVLPIEMKSLAHDSTVRVRTGPIIKALGPADRPTEVKVATRVAGVTLFVLVIAVANVTNLLLLRATRRKREIALRRALGVTRMQLVEQLTLESLMLSSLGGVVAVVFCIWAGTALRRLVLPRVQWATGPVDLQTTTFVGLAAVLVGLVAGITAATHAMKPDITDSLRSGSRETHRGSKLRSGLLAVQAALCLVLLVGSGLFIRSLNNVQSIDIGFDRDNLIFIRPQFEDAGKHDAEMQAAIPEAAKRLRTIDGVVAVAFTSASPFQSARFNRVSLPGRDSLPQLPGDFGPSQTGISPDFFKASGLQLKQGRDFNDRDVRGSQPVAIISESLARLYWPGEPALGKCVMFGQPTAPCSIIVGVSADPHRMRIIEKTTGQIYYPLAQSTDDPTDLLVRTHPDRETAVSRAADQILRPLIGSMDGLWAQTFRAIVEPQVRSWRLGAILFTALGVLALLVASVGVYSVIAYAVGQRLHEMGIRIALGARTPDIIRLVLVDGVRVLGVGILLGAAGSLALGRFIASLLFGIQPNNAMILAGASLLLCGVGILACLIPSWRASRVDPATTLRVEA